MHLNVNATKRSSSMDINGSSLVYIYIYIYDQAASFARPNRPGLRASALDLDDEAAMQHFQVLINESTNALFPQIFETTHRWAQYWR